MIFIHLRRQRLIDDYLAGGLSQEMRKALESHFAKCAECRELLEKEKLFNQKVTEAGEFLDQAVERMTSQVMEFTPYTETQEEPLTQLEEKEDYRPFLKQRWVWVTVIAAFIVVNCLIWFYHAPSYQLTPIQVAQSLGQGVWVKSYGTSQWVKLQTGELKPGDQIKTDDYSQFSLKMGNAAQCWFHPSSQATIVGNSSSAFILEQGETYVSVSHLHNSFRVETPAGMIEVHGTEFQVAVDSSQKTEVSCIQDAVYFENSKGKVVLQEGYESNAQSNIAPSQPVQVDTQRFIEWKKQMELLVQLSPDDRLKTYMEYITHANQFYHKQQYADALETYRLAASLNPESSSSYYGVGRTYRTMGYYALATAAYAHALQQNPEDAVSRLQWAQSLVELKQYSEAENILHKEIERRPEEHANWVALGDAYLLGGNLQSAQQAYQRAIQLGADTCVICNPEVYGGLGEIARRENNLHAAQSAFGKINPSSSIPSLVYAEQAWLYHDLGNTAQETSAWNHYLQLDPKGPFAEYAKSRLSQRASSN
jgi:tetratricopeptide (TPR) repeat protein